MRPPTPRQIPTVVCVRRATPSSTSTGNDPTYTNTLYRANVASSAATARGDDGLAGSTRSARLLFAADPGVQAGDLILVPPVLASDPPSPAYGALWVDRLQGSVRYHDGSATTTLATVAGLYTTPLVLYGPRINDLGGGLGSVLVAEGPAADSHHLGLQYRIDATEQS